MTDENSQAGTAELRALTFGDGNLDASVASNSFNKTVNNGEGETETETETETK